MSVRYESRINQVYTRVERYERVRVEFSKKDGGWSLLSIVVSTSADCGMTASLNVGERKRHTNKRYGSTAPDTPSEGNK